MDMTWFWKSVAILLCFVSTVCSAPVDAVCPNNQQMKDCSNPRYQEMCSKMICLRMHHKSSEIECKSDPCRSSCIPRFYLKSSGGRSRLLTHTECGGFS